MTQGSPGKEGDADIGSFNRALEDSLAKRNMSRSQICDEADSVSKRILQEYGAVFLAEDKVLPPPVCIFGSSDEVNAYQARLQVLAEDIGGDRIELQAEAMRAYLEARSEAMAAGLDITPRGGPEAAKRKFEDTLEFWNDRVDRGCKHWLEKGRLTQEQVDKIKSLQGKEQIKEIFEYEKEEIFFNTFFNYSILYSVAAPGSSQHLALLALDIKEFPNPKIRAIMGNHGWFRTVRNDAPHFTFLGKKESELASLGLKKFENKDGEFWIPDIK
jgi:hypothetical protein